MLSISLSQLCSFLYLKFSHSPTVYSLAYLFCLSFSIIQLKEKRMAEEDLQIWKCLNKYLWGTLYILYTNIHSYTPTLNLCVLSAMLNLSKKRGNQYLCTIFQAQVKRRLTLICWWNRTTNVSTQSKNLITVSVCLYNCSNPNLFKSASFYVFPHLLILTILQTMLNY